MISTHPILFIHYSMFTYSNSPIQINISLGSVWVSELPHHSDYISVQSANPISDVNQLIMHIANHIDSIKQSFGYSYGSSRSVCTYMKQSTMVHKCGIMTLETKLTQSAMTREYDIYEELWLGALPLHAIPFHHLAYIELVIEGTNYCVAIETSIRHKHRIQIFVDTSNEGLTDLLMKRYLCYRITLNHV